MKCKQLDKLLVVSEWQDVLCPKCKHYFKGKCLNTSRTSENDECHFDKVPLQTVVNEEKTEEKKES
jgi:phage FluMu protein Com